MSENSFYPRDSVINVRKNSSNKETGVHGGKVVLMVIVDIKDQERFDEALISLTCI